MRPYAYEGLFGIEVSSLACVSEGVSEGVYVIDYASIAS